MRVCNVSSPGLNRLCGRWKIRSPYPFSHADPSFLLEEIIEATKMHTWGILLESASAIMESVVDALPSTHVLSALTFVNLFAIYTVGRTATTSRLIVLCASGWGCILIWVAGTLALHHAGVP